MNRNTGRSATTIILRYRNSPAWLSIKTLRRNLLESYQIALPSARFALLSRKSAQIPQMISQSLRREPRLRLIFIETNPPPTRLLEVLRQDFSLNEIELTFHVYGDFTLLSPEWAQLLPLLSGFRVRFVVASRAHFGLVGRLIGKEAERKICPLASDESIFNFARANHFRRKLKIPLTASVLIYTGRLSLEKNPDLILFVAKRLAAMKTDADWRLIICGDFDNVGEQFGGAVAQKSFRKKWQDTLSELPQDVRTRIIMTGSLNPKNLVEALRASDLFISLSTHHDEDFGLSPAESLMAGTPCLLSDWGGFRDFQRLKTKGHRFCRLVPVRLGAKGPEMDLNVAAQIASEILARPLSGPQKNQLSRSAQKALGIDAVAQRLRQINLTSPRIFRDSVAGLAREHSLRVMGLRHGFAAFHQDRRKDSLYLKVYASYYQAEAKLPDPKRAVGARRSKKSK